MKNNQNELEQRLLSQASLDELIKMKMEEELKAKYEEVEKEKIKKTITEISKVPSNLIFSKYAVYKLFNRVNRTETYINGLQAEAMLGLQSNVREKIKSGQMDVFSTPNAYIRFEKVEC